MNRPTLHSDALRGLRKALLLLWLAALALCCAAACERDGLPGELPATGAGDESEAVAWAVFQAVTGSGIATRADDLYTDHGTEDEYALAPGNYHFILLYKGSAATPEAVIPLQSPNAIADRPSNDATKKLVAVYGLKEAQVPEFEDFLRNFEALALLNFDPVQLGLDNNGDLGDWANIDPKSITVSRETLKSKLLNSEEGNALGASIVVGGTRYYTMTSSVYVANNAVVYGWETQTNELFDSKQKAISAALNGKANIATYVERVVAKVVPLFAVDDAGYLTPGDDYADVMFFEGLTSDGPDGDDRYDYRTSQRSWKAKLLGYGLNGREVNTRLFKSLSPTNYWAPTAQKPLNDAAQHRSHWAQDENYTINAATAPNYPHQYRTALEVDTLRDYHRTRAQREAKSYPALLEYRGEYGEYTNYVPDWEERPNVFDLTIPWLKNGRNSSYSLMYIPFDSLQYNANADLVRNRQGSGNPKPLYVWENTYDDRNDWFGDRGYFTTGTHLLVACQLEIEGVAPGTHLYKDQNDIFYYDLETLLRAKFELVANKALPGGNAGLNILHVDWLNHNPEGAYVSTLSWPIDSKFYIDRGHGAGLEEWMDPRLDFIDLTLIPAELTGGDGQLLIAPAWYGNRFAIGTDPATATTLTYNQVVSLFHKLVGPIDHYKNGYMYYAAPIGHNDRDSGSWKSATVGSVGVVRNHSYQLDVRSVSQPGRPVDMAGQPIIPLLDIKRDYIDVSVKILDWHSISQDNVPMRPSQN